MVQVIQTGKSRAGKLSEALGASLGEGLGEFVGSYMANKDLEKTLTDPKLKDASPYERMSSLQQSLAPHGERGQKLFQQRMMLEQQRESEREKGVNLKKGDVLRRRLAGETISEKERGIFSPEEELAIAKHEQSLNIAQLKSQGKKTQASQPIDPQQLAAINKVESSPEFRDASLTEKGKMLRDANVSKENTSAILDPFAKQGELEYKKFESSYKAQEDFINETTDKYKGFETEMKPKLMQMQSMDPESIIGPTAAVFLDHLGIPLGALEDPSSELYNKLSQDLLKGLPETYGSRILKVEVDNFLKTIPTLLNSVDGRRMIASNMLKLGEMKEVYYKEMRKQQRASLDTNKPLPRDFQQQVFDQVKPQVDRINNEFVKMSEVKSVPPGTVPFFSPSGEIEFVPKEHAQWAEKNGGRRIW